MLKRSFGIDQTNEWTFVSDQVEQMELSRTDVDWASAAIPEIDLDQNTNVDLVGVLMGDVDGSWVT